MLKRIFKAKALLSIALVLCLVAAMLPTGVFTVFAAERATSTWGGAGDVAESFAGGTGKKDDSILISTAAQLALLAENVNGGTSYAGQYIKLTADIDLDGKDWTPIGGGTAKKSFQGIFDGDGHTIRNLSVTGTTNLNFGLFGQITNATIKNLHLTDAVVTAGDTTGNLVVGGLVGKMISGSVLSGCSFNGTVTTSGTDNNRYVGALVGWYVTSSGQQGGEIVNCFSTGTITLNQKARVGGLVGIAYDTTNGGNTELTIKNSYCAMNITGATVSGVQAAGLVANLSSSAIGLTIENSFFAGTIDVAYPFTYTARDNITIKSDVYVKEGWCTKTGTITPGGAGVDTLTDRTKTAEEFKNGTVTGLLNGNLSIWMTGREYPIHKRALPTLSTLTVNNQKIELAKGFTEYDAAQVEHNVGTAQISAKTALAGVTVTVNGAEEDGTVALGIPGTTTKITIDVVDDMVSNTYTVNVYRKPAPWNGTDIEPFAGGTGTQEDPYLIANAAQLNFMAKTASDLNGVTIGDKHYPYNNYSNKVEATSFNGRKYIKIIADIDLNNKPWTAIAAASANGTSSKDSDGVYTFTAASAFKGNLNGDNHTISNMNCTVGSGKYYGFFAMVSGSVIENLHFKSATVNNGSTGSVYMGGITAKAYSTVTFKNCSFDGDVKRTVTSGGTAVFAGGLVGMVQMGSGNQLTLENCWSTGTVSQYANNAIGALVGNTYNTNINVVIKSSWSSMKVENTREEKLAGGLVGGLSDGAVLTITDSYFNGLVNLPYPICSDADGVTLQNVHYASDYYAGTDASAVTGGALTNATAQTDATFADGTVTKLLNGDKAPVWATSTAGYPVLTDLVATANNALSPVGTSIRSKGDSQGIRFKFAISNEAKTAMLKEAGVVVAQLTDANGDIKAALKDENLTMHNLQKGDAGYYKYVAEKAYEKGSSKCAFVNYTDDKDWFAAALVNFNTPEKLTNKYIARSYAIFTDARGQEILVYSDVMGDKKYHVSVEDVAKEYYNNESLRAQLTEEELSYIRSLVLGANWYVNADWNDDGVLKILAIGNSFSDDSMNHVYAIAQAAGVQEIYLGNLYYAGCTIEQHLSYAKNSEAKYEYRVNTNGNWVTTTEYKLADAVKDENWDFISFQQGSAHSGRPQTYEKLDDLMDFVTPLCTNPKVKFAWHMTWAYQHDCTQSAFGNYYENDQMTMYNAIISTVQEKIVTNDRIVKIIPNGTAIQNARTSYIGDDFTRDGYHLHKPKGRFIAGLSTVETLIGIDWDKFDVSSLLDIYPEDEQYFDMAIESVKNAVAKPFEVTRSTYTETAE